MESLWIRELILLSFLVLGISDLMMVRQPQRCRLPPVIWSRTVSGLYWGTSWLLAVLLHQLIGWPLRIGWLVDLNHGCLIQFLSGLLLFAGLSLALWARWTMRDAFQPPGLRPTEETPLIVDGPFRWTRNPNYLGYLIMWIGAQGLLLSEFIFFVWIPWLLFLGWIHREEVVLHEKYGNQYREYCRTVPQFF
ncbi:MAG: isoprenylcysteine carboxylmethyltransferase family protein [Ignavibacteriae bacterium]|nr:isoprenylcysteine carboxylmethyltransferase family protein [Ignavibacteriota bacterium]